MFPQEVQLLIIRFHTLHETSKRHAPNKEYENFVTAHLKAAAVYLQIKPKAKHRVPWESKAIIEKKQDNMKKASLLKRINKRQWTEFSSICLETLLKLQINQLNKLSLNN